jgi:hypothetical protein
VVRYREIKHQSIIQGPNWSIQLWLEPLHWETAVVDFLDSVKRWLCLKDFDIAEWICWHCVEMFLTPCAREIWMARNKAMWGTKWPATDLGIRAGTPVRINVINGLKLAVRFWVWVGSELEPLQQILLDHWTEPHWTRAFLASFTLLHTENFGSNSVFELWLYLNMIYTYKIQFWMLHHLWFSNFRCNHYSLCRFEKP